jgi:hypothetical protein
MRLPDFRVLLDRDLFEVDERVSKICEGDVVNYIPLAEISAQRGGP